MPKPLPEYLQYFLSDCLQWDKAYSVKSMFWGYGIYKHEKIFAIYAWDTIYMKVWPQNAGDYTPQNSRQFVYQKKWKDCLLSYWQLPEEVLEDTHTLEQWIEKSLDYS